MLIRHHTADVEAKVVPLLLRGKKGGSERFGERVKRERIKEHLKLDVRKAAAASEEAGQHRGRVCQAHGTHRVSQLKKTDNLSG